MKKRLRAYSTVLFLACSGLVPLASTAQAITYGSTVADLTKTAPYVVSIWTSPDHSQSDAIFICTGSLIAPHIVLTAAHCTTDSGSYFVKVGSKALKDETPFTSVSGVWHNPKYDSKTFQNDIGLLKINNDASNITYPSLANSQVAQSINAKTSLQLFGWGRDQSGNLADLLRTTSIVPQDAAAAKSFRGVFKPATMLAAGRKIQAQNLYSGGCSGDSGGPLVTNMNGITYLVGVTNWGAESCTKGTPTIFARVSSYQNDIRAGINSVETLAQVADRTAPTYTTVPAITGNVIPGQTLTCSPGVWQNAVSVEVSWVSPNRIAGSTNSTITVKPSDAGAQFRCRVIANSKNSSTVFNTPAKVRTPSDSLVVNPTISGIQTGVQVEVGSVARCDGWSWKIPVDSDSVDWYSTSANSPSAPVNGKLLGSGKELTLTQEIIRAEKGRYLTCQITGLLGGFSSFGTASVLISAPDAPVINNISLDGYSLTNASTMSCTYSATGNISSSLVEWGTPSGYSGFTPFGQTGTSIQITPSIIQLGAGKPIACRVTVSNAGGDTSRFVTSSNTFEVAPAAPTVTATAYSLLEGYSASCSASLPGSFGASFNYQWGIASNSAIGIFDISTLGTGNSLSLTSDILIKAAGKYLVCQATTSNNAGTSVGFGRIAVPSSAAPSLPTLIAPTLGSQSAASGSVTANLNISAISGFSSGTMDLRLHLPGASCDNQQILSTPTSISCSGLSGSTSYSTYLTISYTSNSLSSNRSLTTSFTSTAVAAPVLAPSALTYNESTVGVIAYIGSGVSCPASNPIVAAEVNVTTGVSYTKCWPQAAWSAWLAGGTTWTNYLASFTVTLPTSPAPIVGAQTAGSSSISVAIQIPSISSFNNSTMQATLVVNGAPTCSSIVVTTGSTQTCSTLTANTTYSAYISISPLSGTATTTRSSSVSFTTTSLVANALTPSFSRATSTSTGFTAQILNYDSSYSWAANITTGNAPSGSVSINATGLISVTGLPSSTTISISVTTNKSGFPQGIGSINATTLASPIDTISPTVVDNSLSMTGYAPIIPTTGAPATSIQIRFGASDNVGIASTSVRLVNPGNVVVSSGTGSFIAGSISSGVYQAYLATSASGPANGDVYQIQAQAFDATGNSSSWVTIGSFTVRITTPSASIQVVISPVDSSGITTIGYCFINASAISGTVSTSGTISGPGFTGTQSISSGSFLAYSGMPSCPNMVGSASGFRLAAGSTFTASVTAFANGNTYSNSTKWTTAPAAIVIPAPTMNSSIQNYGVQTPGRNFTFTFGMTGAVSVSATASNGATNLNAPFLQGPSGDNWIYATSGGSGGTTGYTGSIAIPISATPGSYSLTYAATNSAGQTTQFAGGSFFIPIPVDPNAPSILSTQLTNVNTPFNYGADSPGAQILLEAHFANAVSVSLSAILGATVITAGFSPGPSGYSFVYRWSANIASDTTYRAALLFLAAQPKGTYSLTWTVTNQSGMAATFSAGSFTLS
jgi:hypothetical protein